MPYLFEHLPFPILNRNPTEAAFLRSLNTSFSNIQWSNEDLFYIEVDGTVKNIQTLMFKNMYWLQFNDDTPPQPFKGRWEAILPNRELDWNMIWGNVHSSMLSYKTQSSLWMMTNLNFISSYSE